MAMQFTLESFVEFIAAISSLFIGTFFILVSVFNQDIKAFIYLAGAFFTYIISGFLFSPCSRAFSLKPSPKTPEGTKTFVLINYFHWVLLVFLRTVLERVAQ